MPTPNPIPTEKASCQGERGSGKYAGIQDLHHAHIPSKVMLQEARQDNKIIKTESPVGHKEVRK